MTVNIESQKLEDIVERVCVGYVGSCNKDYTESSNGVPMIRTTNLTGTYIDYEDIKYISHTFHKKHIKSQLKRGDILVARHGENGLPAIYESDEEANCLNVVIIKPFKNKDYIDNYYLLYAIKSPQVVNQIKAAVGGSVQGVVNTKVIAKLDIPYPKRSQREAIVNYLFTLDNKIQVSKRINKTLEEIAQVIFKSWFVDFEPVKAKIVAREALIAEYQTQSVKAPSPQEIAEVEKQAAIAAIAGAGDIIPTEQLQTLADLFPNQLVESELGEIPVGWGIDNLSQLIEFNPKRVLKRGVSAPYLDMKNVPTQGHLADDVVSREMGSGTKFINGDTLLARITPCLENGKTAYVDFLEDGQVGWGSTEYIVMRPRTGIPNSIGYVIARQDVFRTRAMQTMTGTSGRQRANAKALSEESWLQYPKSLLKEFDKISGSYLKKAKTNGDEIKLLKSLRDTLLPKLLNGDISLNSDKES